MSSAFGGHFGSYAASAVAVCHYLAPNSLADQSEGILSSLEVVDASTEKLGDCTICLCEMGKDAFAVVDGGGGDANDSEEETVVRLSCSHCFHRNCLESSLKNHKPVCPICRKPVREPQGACPSGSMSVSVNTGYICPGFRNKDGTPTQAIVINYSIPSGTQKSYHYHPGVKFSGTSREAYLPHNIEGHELLARLVYAWSRGLIFNVGTSLTSHAQNVVTWTSIHHKTSLSGGSHGFPDDGYVLNTNESLDGLYVPDGESCRADKKVKPIVSSLPPPPDAAADKTVDEDSGKESDSTNASAKASETALRRLIFSNPTIAYNAPAAMHSSKPLGPSPSGTMTISLLHGCSCPGFFHPSGSPAETICIQYDIPQGVQKSYHENPGVTYRGVSRLAYVPDTVEGHKLLLRLICSWKEGWNLAVGTSMTTGRSNAVVWSTLVPHKTGVTGGPFGFPDVSYIQNCNLALDALNIPTADACMAAATASSAAPDSKRART